MNDKLKRLIKAFLISLLIVAFLVFVMLTTNLIVLDPLFLAVSFVILIIMEYKLAK